MGLSEVEQEDEFCSNWTSKHSLGNSKLPMCILHTNCAIPICSDQQAVALAMCVYVLFLRSGHNSHSWYRSTYDQSYLSGASIVSVYRQAVY